MIDELSVAEIVAAFESVLALMKNGEHDRALAKMRELHRMAVSAEQTERAEMLAGLMTRHGVEIETPWDEAVREVAMIELERRLKSLKALRETNRIPPSQEAQVRALDAELAGEIPQKTPRYAEIAQRLDMKRDRVRYIIEGARRSKK